MVNSIFAANGSEQPRVDIVSGPLALDGTQLTARILVTTIAIVDPNATTEQGAIDI